MYKNINFSIGFLAIAMAFFSCKNNETKTEETNADATFTKIDPTKIQGNVFQTIGQDWMLITAGNQEKYNTMTASWGMLGELWGKHVANCFVNPNRYTFNFMEESEYYTLCFFDMTKYRDALNFCGSKSGRDFPNENKAEAAGLTPAFTDNGTPYFKEARLVIECKKIYAEQFDPKYFTAEEFAERFSSNTPEENNMHKFYIGEIVNVWEK
ncbi:MAG: flavin reductase family protein [Prevotellaceae bacterium]|jgi:flavin reductase (DIM6/NTAB) family NADH-FMN oxidoreductase RutF|nr:flavin reductase family protein [Prevotellaceae bacterium]